MAEGLGRRHPTDFVSAFGKQAIKQYLAYDASNRVISIYEATAEAVDGDKCLLTTYAYDGTSSRVAKFKEEVSTWVSATMDI